ncbi:MAG TPA: hypothetical protein PKA41_09070 [Verrucomicrobiota bacterium]|nr:hypothetical protein [Verrucomicrobiota bacterium]
MNMADAIPVILLLMLGFVLGLVVIMVAVAIRLKRRNVLLIHPTVFIPGKTLAGSQVMVFSNQLMANAVTPQRSRRTSARQAPLPRCERAGTARGRFRLNSRRR